MAQLEMENKKGLSIKEAAARLVQYGPNQLQEEKKISDWILIGRQFTSPLVIILIFACLLSALLGEIPEAIAILAILALNALIGFFQERKAENAIAALKQMTAPRATVLRENQQMQIPASEIVPGDILLVEAGDIVGADAKVFSSSRLQMNEAVLTGESFPVEKNTDESIFTGTAVVAGTAKAEVFKTGMNTELGKIAHLVSTAQSSHTPLQDQLAHVGQTLLYVCIVIVLLIAGINFFEGRDWTEILIFSISLAVAAVPEGMPAIVTVALALGVQRMAARNALVRKLHSVETLGSVTVICTDKTGTLTTGNMRVRELWGENHHQLLECATSCCEAELQENNPHGTGDPTEIAILLAAQEREIFKNTIEQQNPRISSWPFDSDRKRMSVFRSNEILYIKGAVESLLEISSDSIERKAAIKRANAEMTGAGLRVLAAGTGPQKEESAITILGLIGIADPPRSEVIDAIKEARTAGILPVMITGDHPITARAIARELGLILEGETTKDRVHSRATPEDKLKLVRQWKERGAVVAMTGDGVNDAPALKEAHIGIAMGKTGTEVTRQSADLILADDNFATIIAAVKEGRSIYQNIRKAILYLLIGNFAEILVVLGASLFALPLPLTAAHLLWINLVTDSLPGLALIADPAAEGIMKQAPREKSEKLLGKKEWIMLLWNGALEATIVLSVYFVLLSQTSEIRARSIAFTTFVFSQLFRSFGSRSDTELFWELGVWTNGWLLATVFGTGMIQLTLHYIPFTQTMFNLAPLTLTDIAIILPLSLLTISTVEMRKLIVRKYNKKGSH